MLLSPVVANGNDSLSNFPFLLSSLDSIGTSRLTSDKTNDSSNPFNWEALQPLSNNSIISKKCAWSIWSQNWNWFYHYQLLLALPGNELFIDFSCFKNSTFYSHTKHPLTGSMWADMHYREKHTKRHHSDAHSAFNGLFLTVRMPADTQLQWVDQNLSF